jgi:hypothetical protein
MQFPENRQLTFSTAYPQDCEDKDLKSLLLRMSEAADYLDSIYRLRAMRIHVERQERELETNRQQRRNIELRHKQQWDESNRKGEFRANGSQIAEYGNFETTEKRYVQDIKKLREEIAELERRTGA